MRISLNVENYNYLNKIRPTFKVGEQSTQPSDQRYNSPSFKAGGWYTSTDPLKIYEQTLRSYPPLTLEEEYDTVQDLLGNDSVKIAAAKEKLIKHNLRFVASIAYGFRNGTILREGFLNVLDLIAAGNEALVKAAELYDGTRGFKLISYAAPRIRTAIWATLHKDARTVRLSDSVIHRNKAINSYINSVFTRTGMMPSIEEIAKNVGLSEDTVKSVINHVQYISYLDAPTDPSDDDSRALIDTIAAPETPPNGLDNDQQEMYDLIVKNIKLLPEKYKTVMTLYYGLDGSRVEKTTLEIAEELKLKPDTVQARKYKAVKMLKRLCGVKQKVTSAAKNKLPLNVL